MNDYLMSVLLGVVEGVTEFLPVSSTAHLRITQSLLDVDLGSGYWKMYAIVIQLGAVLCLPLYFRGRLAQWLRALASGPRTRGAIWRHPFALTGYAFACTMVLSLLSVRLIGKHLEDLVLMAQALVAGGVVMGVVDVIFGRRSGPAASVADTRARRPTESVDEMTVPQAIWIGCCQALSAVFPGTSRSMATIAAGQIAGMSRPAALEFSFLLSIPTMIAATGYDLLGSLRHAGGGGAIGVGPANAHEWIVLAIGFVTSFIVAYAVVAWFMDWVRRRGFIPFAVYRIVAGLAVWWWAIHRAVV